MAGAFSPALLVPVATTGTNGLYKPGLKAFFPPVGMAHSCAARQLPRRITVILSDSVIFYLENRILVLLKYTRKL
jgi:hypothetical protein